MSDPTIICVQLPNYAPRAAKDVSAPLQTRHGEKTGKQGCTQANRRFLPVIITTLGGIGMSDFWDWWDTIWSEAVRAHADKGAPAHEAAEGKRRAVARLQAVITRHTANAIQNLAYPERTVPVPCFRPATLPPAD